MINSGPAKISHQVKGDWKVATPALTRSLSSEGYVQMLAVDGDVADALVSAPVRHGEVFSHSESLLDSHSKNKTLGRHCLHSTRLQSACFQGRSQLLIFVGSLSVAELADRWWVERLLAEGNLSILIGWDHKSRSSTRLKQVRTRANLCRCVWKTKDALKESSRCILIANSRHSQVQIAAFFAHQQVRRMQLYY